MPRVGKRRRGRFVNDAHDVQARDLARVLRRLTARVVEIIRNRDHGVGDRVAELVFAVLLEFAKNEGGYEFRGDLLTVESAVIADGAHLTFDALDDVFRIFHRRAAAVRTDDDAFIARKENNTSRFDVVVFIRNRSRLTFVIDNRQGGEGRAQVDTNCFSG